MCLAARHHGPSVQDHLHERAVQRKWHELVHEKTCVPSDRPLAKGIEMLAALPHKGVTFVDVKDFNPLPTPFVAYGSVGSFQCTGVVDRDVARVLGALRHQFAYLTPDFLPEMPSCLYSC